MKTSELTGALLDWAVAKAEKVPGLIYVHGTECWINLSPVGHDVYCPSTGAEGDDIIDRERIGTEPLPHRNEPAWQALIHSSSPYAYTVIGSTRRIAAMRCFVASKLGNEIDIPKELL